MKDNKTIVEKADIAVANLISDGGYLNPIQANTFIRMLIEQPTLVNEVRVVPMNAPTMEINKIGVTSRILRKAPQSGQALPAAKRSKPETDKVTLSTKEVIAEVHIPYDVLEDNIERGSLEDTIMTLITERASLDLEELILLGNTGSADEYLAMMNGIINQLTSHVVDFSATMPNVTKEIFKAGIKAMPNKYLRNQSAMRFFVSPDADIEYADSLANRETGLGDRNIERWPYGLNVAYGIPIKPVALMPNWAAVLTYPKNIILCVQRQVMIETDRDIRARVLIVVLTMRIDIKFEEEDAGVKIIGLEPSATTTTTAP
jgi:hypothetical protein